MWVTIGKIFFGWIVTAVMDEGKKLWQDDQIQVIAKDAVSYAKDRIQGNDKKAKEARRRIKADAEAAGIKIGKHALDYVAEQAYNRWIK